MNLIEISIKPSIDINVYKNIVFEMAAIHLSRERWVKILGVLSSDLESRIFYIPVNLLHDVNCLLVTKHNTWKYSHILDICTLVLRN